MFGLNEIVTAIRRALSQQDDAHQYEPGDTLLVNKYIEEAMLYGAVPDSLDQNQVCGHRLYEGVPPIH